MSDESGPREGGHPSPGESTLPVVRPAAGTVARPSRRPPPPPPREELPAMSLLEHLEELRSRLLRCLLALAVTTGISWWQAERIFHFLAVPIYKRLPPGQRLVMLSVTDGFLLYIKVALLAGVFVAAPVLLYHLWRFIAPGLYRREQRYVVGFIVTGTLLFLAGGAFAYYVAFPFAVEFLLAVGHEFAPSITGVSYLSFLMTVILGLALMFELPLVIVFLARVGLVTPRFLLRNFRYAVLIIFVAAAIITPTSDVFNLCLFAVPTLLLYLLGVAAAALVVRSAAKAKAAAEAAEAAEAEEAEAGEPAI
ncbi:MAG TPA: twin-arginine translocase subunit TatC [Thermoanaerobaculia bacterium]|nr:twin-arginine translocase subunit TatC [Thermoanaerobaculia bacterium]